VTARGSFIHVNPSDPIHYGKGGVTVYQDLVHLDDFEVGPGPAFHVYLVPAAEVRDEADVESAMFVDLGRLRAFKGSQNYPSPAGVDLAGYQSVVIWCERFGVLISPATLEFRS
jgi:Electron transfer DM13